MRFLLGRTDALGDVVISLPVRERILSRMPEAEVHWLVRPYAAPLLRGLGTVHLREDGQDLAALLRAIAPDAVLNLGHRDQAIITAARAAGVPVRVARSRGRQIWEATHVLWNGRNGTGRPEAMNVLDFLKPWGWEGGWPAPPRLVLDAAERERGRADLAHLPRPRLGVATRSSGSSAYPSAAWWDRALAVVREAGWTPVILSPPEDAPLPPADLRGLLARIAACDVFLGPSTGPTQIAGALDVPTLALMGLTSNRGPSRWAPLGRRVQVLQYPPPEADLSGGMDRLDPRDLLPHLARLAQPEA
ncbi:glycosyltransferase family 9 protein [Mesoterricola sediminis]|nr:glycosyltransferase family 9 protein [Mesoterricola sediminis]